MKRLTIFRSECKEETAQPNAFTCDLLMLDFLVYVETNGRNKSLDGRYNSIEISHCSSWRER